MKTQLFLAGFSLIAALAAFGAGAQDVNSRGFNPALRPPGPPSAPNTITVVRNASDDDPILESAQLESRTTPLPPMLSPMRSESATPCPGGARCDPLPNAVSPLPSGGGR